MLVDDFIANFNEHRIQFYEPSDSLVVDESMVRWYGQGGDWINHGLPHYLAIDRKPEDGCEIQDCADGRSGVMMQLKIVKSAKKKNVSIYDNNNVETDDDTINENQTGLPHGCKVMMELLAPWFHTNRLICADSYFASVSAARELFRVGLRFIGVVKQAHRHFPKEYLQKMEMLQNRGQRIG